MTRDNVPHKIAEFFSNWDGDENAKMEISVNDMREIAFVYTKKARIERQLKEKALEKEPCEDAISRKAILDCQYTIAESETLGISTRNVVNVDDILKAKPVTPQPKTGHWIYLKHNKAKCSECHDIVLIAQMYGNANYCPNCGMRMINVPDKNDGMMSEIPKGLES